MIPQYLREISQDVFTLYTLYILVSVAMLGLAVVRAVPMYIKGPWDRRFQGGVWIVLTLTFTYYTYLYHKAKQERDVQNEKWYRELLLATIYVLIFLWLFPAILGFYGW